MAEALFRRAREVIGEKTFAEFRDVQFLVCVPAFTTLQAQTAIRVRQAGLLDRVRKEDEYSKVVMYTPGTLTTLDISRIKPDQTLLEDSDASTRLHSQAAPAVATSSNSRMMHGGKMTRKRRSRRERGVGRLFSSSLQT